MTALSEHDARIRELNADDAWLYNAPSLATSPVPKMPPVRTLRYTHLRHATDQRKYPPLRSLLAWVPRPNKNKKEN